MLEDILLKFQIEVSIFSFPRFLKSFKSLQCKTVIVLLLLEVFSCCSMSFDYKLYSLCIVGVFVFNNHDLFIKLLLTVCPSSSSSRLIKTSLFITVLSRINSMSLRLTSKTSFDFSELQDFQAFRHIRTESLANTKMQVRPHYFIVWFIQNIPISDAIRLSLTSTIFQYFYSLPNQYCITETSLVHKKS